MKKLLLSVFGLIALCSVSYAQIAAQPGPGPVPCAYTLCTVTGVNATSLGTVTSVVYGFNSAKTGLFSGSQDGNIQVSINGTSVFQFAAGVTANTTLVGNIATSYELNNAGTSSTVPTLIPNRSSATTGIGAQASGNMSEIIAGSEVARWTAGGLVFVGTIPIVTGTGTPTIVTGSTDTAGEVTSGTTATSVVITFAASKANAPFCTVTPQTQLVAFSYTISTAAITITQTATTGEKIDYHCFQH